MPSQKPVEESIQTLDQATTGVIWFSERDLLQFIESINSPPEPTAKLLEAAAAYKQLRIDNPDSNW
jgi:uncharacterized protein (DUF1778 family)